MQAGACKLRYTRSLCAFEAAQSQGVVHLSFIHHSYMRLCGLSCFNAVSVLTLLLLDIAQWSMVTR